MSHHRALGCPCGIGGLGATGFPAPAGEIAGIATLLVDLRNMSNSATWLRGFTFNKPLYDVTRAKIRTNTLVDKPMTASEARNFFMGVMGQIADAIVRAKLLAAINVPDAAARAANQAAQAALIGPAQLMWDSMEQVMRGLRPASSGTSGLGQFDPITLGILVVGGVVVLAVVGTAAIVGITYLIDSSDRLEVAAGTAGAICARAHPPCTPEQAAAVLHSLALGPLDNAAAAAAKPAADALSTAMIWIAGIGAITGVGVWLYKRHEDRGRAMRANRRRRRRTG